MGFAQKHAELSGFLDERPVWREDWRWLLAIAVLGYAASVAVRMVDAGPWTQPGLSAAGETIMGTHDTYGWLAAAKGVGWAKGYGMAELASLLAAVFGAPLWKIGFWAPAFLAGFSAVATGLWGWLLGGRRAAIAAGALGALSPGFYLRSRLGFYDSDVFTLLMPLLIGFMLAHLLSFTGTRGWFATGEERREDGALPAALPFLALAYGLVARVAHFAHDDIQPIGVVLLWMALGLAALTSRPGRRLEAFRLLVVYALAAYAGQRAFSVIVFHLLPLNIAGVAVAVAVAALLWRRPERARPLLDHPWVWVALFAAVAVLGGLLLPLGPFFAKALAYFKPVADAAKAGAAVGGEGGPVYPGITQSIREAKNVVNWPMFFTGLSVAPAVGALGFLGMLAVLALRPAAALLLPLMGLGVCSLFMGVRFAMFAGPPVALGLGLGAHWVGRAILARTGGRDHLLTLAQIVLAGLCLLFYVGLYGQERPTPVVAAAHAEGLMKLRAMAPKDAVVWTWWDFGYATQYYAERATPTDGGRHAGRDMYPTALAMTTPSPRQAAQVINLSAVLNHDPARRWDKLPAAEVQQSLAALAASDQPMKRPPKQYFVVCWENMTLLYWIGFYGTWDLVRGGGTHPKMQIVQEAFNIEPTRGVMLFRGGAIAPIPVSSVDMLTPQGPRRANFTGNPGAPHLVINDVARTAILMDDLAYHSMAVQLLIGDPGRADIAASFKLAHEGFPLVRIYEVLPPAREPEGQAEAFTQ